MRWRQPDKYPLARWLSRRPGSQPLVVIIAKSEIPLAGILGRPAAASAETTTVSPRIGRNATLARKQASSQRSSARNFFLLAFRTHTNTGGDDDADESVLVFAFKCIRVLSRCLSDQRCDVFFGAKNDKTQRAVGV
jgi:hypothetical protein